MVWKEAPTKVLLGWRCKSRNIRGIEHLNLTPDLLTTAVQRYLGDGPEKIP